MNRSPGWLQVSKLAEAICNDSFFTYVNLLYPVQTVALSSVILAAMRYKYLTPLQHYSRTTLENGEGASALDGLEFNFEGCFQL